MKKLFLKKLSILTMFGCLTNFTQAANYTITFKMPENATWYAAGTLALLGASYGLYKAIPKAWLFIESQNNQRVINRATAILDKLSSQNINRLSFSPCGTRPIVEKAVDLVSLKLKDEAAKQLNNDFTSMYAKIRQVENGRSQDLEATQRMIQQNAKMIKRRLVRAQSF